MSAEDERLAAAFADLVEAEGSGADLHDVRDRIRRRRTRRAAAAGSLATLVAIGGIALGAQSLTSGTALSPAAPVAPSASSTADPPERGDGAAPSDPPPTDLPRTSVTLTVAGEDAVELDDFEIYCTKTPGGRGPAPDPVLWLEGIDYGDEDDPAFSLLQVLLAPELVVGGDRLIWDRQTEPAADTVLFGLVGEAENSSREEGADLSVDILAGDGCTPGSDVALRISGTVGSELLDGEPMRVEGAIVGPVTAEPGFVDPSGELATNCSAIRRRDVTSELRPAYEPLGDGSFARVRVGGATFLVDASDPACEKAPGIGSAIETSRDGGSAGRSEDLAEDVAPSAAAERQARAFVRFAEDPTPATREAAGFSRDGVALYSPFVGDDELRRLAYDDLLDPARWTVRVDQGTASAPTVVARPPAYARDLSQPRPPRGISGEPIAVCAMAPLGTSIASDVSVGGELVERQGQDRCFGGYRVDLAIERGEIVAVSLTVRGP